MLLQLLLVLLRLTHGEFFYLIDWLDNSVNNPKKLYKSDWVAVIREVIVFAAVFLLFLLRKHIEQVQTILDAVRYVKEMSWQFSPKCGHFL